MKTTPLKLKRGRPAIGPKITTTISTEAIAAARAIAKERDCKLSDVYRGILHAALL